MMIIDRAAIAPAPDWLYDILNAKRPAAKRAAKKAATVELVETSGGALSAYDDTPPFPYSTDNAKLIWSWLVAIPPEKRDAWLRIGAALHSMDDSWEHRRRGFWAWAKRTTAGNFDPDDQEKTWEGFSRDREDGVTWRTNPLCGDRTRLASARRERIGRYLGAGT
jgi:hypothetical protein